MEPAAQPRLGLFRKLGGQFGRTGGGTGALGGTVVTWSGGGTGRPVPHGRRCGRATAGFGAIWGHRLLRSRTGPSGIAGDHVHIVGARPEEIPEPHPAALRLTSSGPAGGSPPSKRVGPTGRVGADAWEPPGGNPFAGNHSSGRGAQ
ncbi:hypothetical protein GCM10010497_37510 [Streptomyces cinereoruber]|uniref:Uncharacterized protein n=1 Tax=Streptomyces cinereoruber TaxID=67260 RepID=A0AAV4KKN0_9ACTN|nr:hypothetical protein GCM10010497_37510 [Streptomyces cinereoruber]